VRGLVQELSENNRRLTASGPAARA
jgi:hypothetical protein